MLQHLTMTQIKQYSQLLLNKKSNEYEKIAIVRNPYTQILSLYKYHLKENMKPISFLSFLLEIKKGILELKENGSLNAPCFA